LQRIDRIGTSAGMRWERLVLGDVEITGFSAGSLRVDGGAMFGVVPRSEWELRCPPDVENRVLLSLNCYLVRTPEALILADSGIGTLLNKKYLDFYGYRGSPDIERLIESLGYRTEDVDIVFHSHLHFDHCGGAMKKNSEGKIVPVFPRARHVVQRGEWANALHPVDRDRPSYFAGNLKPLAALESLDLLDGTAAIAEGIEAVLLPGHTACHQGLKVVSGGGTFFFPGDLIPTSAHVGLASIMSFDLYPVESQDNKKKVYAEALAGGWILGFSHDPACFFGGIRRAGRGYEFVPREG
jgi:glyoxylase-like metal-dependent hydrolase (beta-lactamase superfamily II)